MKTIREATIYKPKWSNEAYKKIVYHGTKLPVGTPFNLEKPEFDRPLFVGNIFEIATIYAASDIRSGSIFVMELTDDPYDISFNFLNKAHLKILARKLPLTAKLIEDTVIPGHEESFFDLSITMDGVAYEFKISGNEKPKDEDEAQVFDSLVELGIIESTKDGKYEFCQKIKNLDIDKKHGEVYTRRIIKGAVFKAICELGFKIALDNDTSGSGRGGNEFAILDLSVIKTGLSHSIENKRQVVSKVLADKYGETTRKFEIEDI